MKYYQKKSFLSFLERGRIVPDHVEERGRGGGLFAASSGLERMEPGFSGDEKERGSWRR